MEEFEIIKELHEEIKVKQKKKEWFKLDSESFFAVLLRFWNSISCC